MLAIEPTLGIEILFEIQLTEGNPSTFCARRKAQHDMVKLTRQSSQLLRQGEFDLVSHDSILNS